MGSWHLSISICEQHCYINSHSQIKASVVKVCQFSIEQGTTGLGTACCDPWREVYLDLIGNLPQRLAQLCDGAFLSAIELLNLRLCTSEGQAPKGIPSPQPMTSSQQRIPQSAAHAL